MMKIIFRKHVVGIITIEIGRPIDEKDLNYEALFDTWDTDN